MSECNRRGCTTRATHVIVFRDPLTWQESTACVCDECAGAAGSIMRQAVSVWSECLETPKEVSDG